MKKVFGFITWKYRQYDFWQKMWWFACFWFGGWIVAQKGSTHEAVCGTLFVISMGIVMFKWFFWDAIRDNWDEYNKEQERIVEIMRDGK